MAFTILEILRREVPVLIQRLSMSQNNRFTVFTKYSKFHISGKILSEIDDRLSIRSLNQFTFEVLHFLDWDSIHSFQQVLIKVFCFYRMPHAVFCGKCFFSRIVYFSLLHIILLQRSCLTCFPCLIRYKHRFSIHFQLT